MELFLGAYMRTSLRDGSIRGVTLVELMIVVAIIAILAGIATVAYSNYIRTGKIQRLQQLALDVSSGQERYRSRNNRYYPADGSVADYASKANEFNNFLDFTTNVPADVTVEVQAWNTGGSCGICEGLEDVARQGYGVRVQQDLNPSSTAMTTIVVTNTTASPILLNEGE